MNDDGESKRVRPLGKQSLGRQPLGRQNLGRGLAALFGEEAAAVDTDNLDKSRAQKTLPVEFLRPGKFQPRHKFDPAQIQGLVDSIREKGILQPILVRRLNEPNAYEIVAGERRWRAAQLAQLHEVPVIIREFADADALEIALVENVQRENLNAMEEAEGYRRLMDEFQHTQEDLSRVVGKSRSHIANLLRLLSLPEGVRAMVESGDLSAGHARALVGVADAEAIARDVVAQGLNVRQIEKLIQARKPSAKAAPAPKREPPHKDADTLALEHELSNTLGLKVSIAFRGGAGELTIHYQTLDQLEDVLRRLKKPAPHHDA